MDPDLLKLGDDEVRIDILEEDDLPFSIGDDSLKMLLVNYQLDNDAKY